MKYADIQAWVSAGLAAKGYGTPDGDPMPRFDPGPPAIQGLWKKSPGRLVFLTLGNGAGMIQEGLYDLAFLTVRALGPQGSYDAAERLASDLDDLLLTVQSNTDIGDARVLYITRTQGPPQLVDYDASNRYHYQSTYLVATKR